MDFNFTLFIALGILAVILIFIGREFEERYPSYIDYKKTGGESTVQQHLRVGIFLVLDYLSDMCWPGNKQGAYAFKRMKRTKEEITQEQQYNSTKQ